jgi:broad specificity phosphatase PhoE
VRHSKSESNSEGKLTGTIDSPLNKKGVRQAEAVGLRLAELQLEKEISFGRIYTSPMKRTLQTVEIAAQTGGFSKIPILATPALNPHDYGDLQGQDREALLSTYGSDKLLAIRRGSTAAPNGESFECAAERVEAFWRQFGVLDLLYGRDVLMVLHGSGLAAMRVTLEGLPSSKSLDPKHTALYVYKFEQVFEAAPPKSSLNLLSHYTLDAAPLMREESLVPAESATMTLTMAAP